MTNKIVKLRGAYRRQSKDAASRGIDFLLSFQEWLRIWEESGHLDERGCRKGQYVMARYGDKGSYEVGNVRIITVEENIAERVFSAGSISKMRLARLGTNHSESTKSKIRKAMCGNKHLLGHKHSNETRAQMSESKLGNTNSKGVKRSEQVRLNASEGQRKRWAKVSAEERSHQGKIMRQAQIDMKRGAGT